jgi:hypothetical protein
VVKCERNRGKHFKVRRVHRRCNSRTQGVVSNQNKPFPGQQGFTTQDILWAVGIWSVILSLSPVIAFYVLMVN